MAEKHGESMTVQQRLDRIVHAPKELVDRLQPPASGDFYFPELDGLRALAICFVIIYHAWWVAGTPQVVVPVGSAAINLTPVFGAGFIGVYLFFVLSGFLLSFPFFNAYFQQRPFPSVRRFYWRRLLRIVPAFYVAILLQVALGTPHWFQGGPDAWRTIPAHLTFLFNFSIQAQSAINGVFWTLGIEMQFYLVLPLIMYLIFKRKAKLVAIALVVIGFGWRYIVFRNFPTSQNEVIFYGEHQFPYHLLLFGVGIAACALYLRIHNRPRRAEQPARRWMRAGVGLSLIGVSVVAWASYRMVSVAFWSGGFDYYLLPIVIAIGFGCLLLGAVYMPAALRRIWSNSPTRFIGIVSYGMYLWHFPILFWISTWPWIAPLAPLQQLQSLLVIGLTTAAIVGLVSLVLVERPFIRLGLRKWQSGRSLATRPITDA